MEFSHHRNGKQCQRWLSRKDVFFNNSLVKQWDSSLLILTHHSQETSFFVYLVKEIHFKDDRNCIKIPLGPIEFCYVRRYPADMYNKSIEHSVIQNWLVRWDKQHQGTKMWSPKWKILTKSSTQINLIWCSWGSILSCHFQAVTWNVPLG